MSEDIRYSRDRLINSYNVANEAFNQLKQEIARLAVIEEDTLDNIVFRKAIRDDFLTFSEFIQHMCKAYLVNHNYGGIAEITSVDSVLRAKDLGFFDEETSRFLVRCVRLRNNYVHEYWKRAIHSQSVLQICLNYIPAMTLFLDTVNIKLIITKEES